MAGLFNQCAATGCGTWRDMRTRVPLIALNQCGVFSGTMMKSPLATDREEPPSMPVPPRFSGLLRFSFTSFPPVTRVNEKRNNPENLGGTGIEGGSSRSVKVLRIVALLVHQFSAGHQGAGAVDHVE